MSASRDEKTGKSILCAKIVADTDLYETDREV